MYLILDEFIMGGELQETSKKGGPLFLSTASYRRSVKQHLLQVILERLSELDRIET